MKTKILILVTLAFLGLSNAYSQVGIGTTSPDGSAALDIEATDKGLLPPRMTGDDRDQINSPAQGLMIYCTNCGTNGEAQVYNGTEWTNMTGGAPTDAFACGDNVTFTYNDSSVTFGTVSGAGSTCWLDRNLGASQVAAASDDADAYGDLYQWGRGNDGHENRSSSTTSGQSTSSSPGANFIIESNWYNGSNPDPDDLWKEDGTGVNNPCPAGFRVPTDAEWDAERGSWNTQDADGAFGSPLKLPMAGSRSRSDGSLYDVGTDGFYWSSSVSYVSTTRSLRLNFSSSDADMSTSVRGRGRSVRCIKE